jgi:predicted TIM-barrel fold metal-dependent hydrolase
MMQKFDADVHVRWRNNTDLAGRLPKSWEARWLHGAGHTQEGLRLHSKYYHPLEAAHCDAAGSLAAFDPGDLAREWMNPQSLDGAVLSVYDAPVLSTFGDIHYPAELARAVNDWMAEEWLDQDERFFGTIVVASQDPLEAAREIRRAARHPRMVQVMLPNGTRQPYGHRFYHPIYEAAVDCGLAVAIHAGSEGTGTSCAPASNGWPGTWLEWRLCASTIFLAHLTSLVTEGVFVRFPELRIIALETGMAWLPAYLWRFDKNYKGLRSECPWLKELPSEYVRRFFRFGSQGVGPADPPAELWRLLRSVGAEKLLMGSSNFPRWDMEAPEDSFVLKGCPEELREGIWAGHALNTYPRLAALKV